MAAKRAGLEIRLTDQQIKALKPLLNSTGSLKIGGTLEGNKLKVSFLACNAAFLACNAAFKITKATAKE